LRRQSLDRGKVGDVRDDRERPPPERADLLGNRVDVAPPGRLLVFWIPVGRPPGTGENDVASSSTAIGLPIDRIRPTPVTIATFPSNPDSV
jgi:hypothetical protein